MSGIMAAKTLADSGVTDFLILEATEKIWVRMRSQKFRGINVELGANWVEGVNGAKTNPIWELARLHNLRTFFSGWNITDNICTDKGRLPTSEAQEVCQRSAAAWEFANKIGLSRQVNNEPNISILTAERLFGHLPSKPVALEYYNYD
ncbi:hypothetical protein SELMODRAFT_442708 [Selaginella moellendorffii]|uniref:Amine oxidase domain-containing protein n=1 Tax=Selaginella moellendorffii TaxID=88036 RepID=D8RVG9_SELML|nr:hypothetical protein SELMODRAFT_442708 [Selaginella moellendorffii]